MHRFVEGEDRGQQALLPASLEDYIDDENPARVVDAFIDELNLTELGFDRAKPKDVGGLLQETTHWILLSLAPHV